MNKERAACVVETSFNLSAMCFIACSLRAWNGTFFACFIEFLLLSALKC